MSSSFVGFGVDELSAHTCSGNMRFKAGSRLVPRDIAPRRSIEAGARALSPRSSCKSSILPLSQQRADRVVGQFDHDDEQDDDDRQRGDLFLLEGADIGFDVEADPAGTDEAEDGDSRRFISKRKSVSRTMSGAICGQAPKRPLARQLGRGDLGVGH